MRDRSWRVVGVGDVQVDGALFQERRWGEGEIERGYKENATGREAVG